MPYVFLLSFIGGLLLAVRIMFFGAERRRGRARDAMPLRRSEPAISAFLLMFGVAGYLLTRHGIMQPAPGSALALLLGALWATLVTRLAIATARVKPEHDPDDPRYLLQGHVAIVTQTIPSQGEGAIAFGDADGDGALRARSIDESAILEGVEVCIERVDGGVAFVERWALVEERL